MPTPCRFCGTTEQKITNEHVWPDWLHNYLPTFVGYSERWSSIEGRQRWRQPMLTSTVRVFCEPCNTGWMSDLEGEVQLIVGPMISSQAADLDGEAQRALANWVALKGLVAAQTSNVERWIPDSHYWRVHHFQGAPPETMLVWIGRRRNLADPEVLGMAEPLRFDLMPVTNVFPHFPTPADVERYRREGGVFNGTIFQVGHFFALALQHDWPGLQARPAPGTRAEDALLPIWPTGSTVHWPPPKPVDDLGDLHKMTRFLQIAPPLAPVSGP